jgi:excinuclease ABC subunit A
VAELPAEDREARVLFGSGREQIDFSTPTTVANRHAQAPFEGIIPNLERRYRKPNPISVREELAKFISPSACPLPGHACAAKRAMCSSPTATCRRSPRCRSAQRASFRHAEACRPARRNREKIVKEIRERLNFLVNVGLDYLTLDRAAPTPCPAARRSASGWPARSAPAWSASCTCSTSRPSACTSATTSACSATLTPLRDLGNTVIVVEHDEDAIRSADHVVDMGPGAGVHGGHRRPGHAGRDHGQPDSLTGEYLSGRAASPCRQAHAADARKKPAEASKGASGNNLKQSTVEIPIGLLTCVTGVSGSGKSTLINDTLFRIARHPPERRRPSPAPHDASTAWSTSTR